MKSEDKTVLVTGDAAGNVIVQSKNNSEYGHIRVVQERMVMDDNGFARKKEVSALIPGTITDLKGFGWKKDQYVGGTVIFKEQLTPFNPKDPERDYKIAGKTGIICKVGDKPIYRKTFYSKSATAEDVSLAHDNKEEIKAAYAALGETEKQGEGIDKH